MTQLICAVTTIYINEYEPEMKKFIPYKAFTQPFIITYKAFTQSLKYFTQSLKYFTQSLKYLHSCIIVFNYIHSNIYDVMHILNL